MAPIAEIPRRRAERFQTGRLHVCKRPAAHRATDTIGCRPYERNVRAQADRKHSVFANGLDQSVAVEVAVARSVAYPVADLWNKRVAGAFDVAYQSIGSIYIFLCQTMFLIVKRIYRQQRFVAVSIFGFEILHIADNKRALRLFGRGAG